MSLFTRFLGSWILLLGAPALSRACTVCFGAQSADMAKGFYWGIILLLALPFGLMAAFIGVIAYHIRKNKRLLPHPGQ